MAGRRKATPDLMGTMPKKRGRPRKKEAPKVAMPKRRGRPRKEPYQTADQIAAEMETEAQKLLGLAKLLREGEK